MSQEPPRPAWLRRSVLAAGLALWLACGCTSIPEGRSAVDSVDVRGAAQVDGADIEDKLATAATPKFLGLFRGVVYEYEVYDRAALQRDLARVERYYRARGYYEVRVRAGRVLVTSANHVRVEIEVEEGRPVVNNALAVDGTQDLPAEVDKAVTRAITRRLRPGAPFDEDEFKAAEADATRALTDNGYAYAKVQRDVFVDIVHRIADARFTVTPDKVATFGKITIVGLDPDGPGPKPLEIPEGPLRRAIDIEEGEEYSTRAITTATQALLDLEVFSSVVITPTLPDPPPEPRVIPLTVTVQPSKLRSVRLGGGFELDQIKTDVHLLIGWENHNFFGGLRDFTVDLKPGVVLYPTRITNFVAPDRLLPEERLQVQFKQPGLLEARTNGFFRPELNTFPLLVNPNPLPTDPVVGYLEYKNGIGVDRPFGKAFASLGYNIQIEAPFSYKDALDPALRLLVISYPELVARLDLRDDHVNPHKGIYLSGDFQVAGGPFNGDASDFKAQPEVRTYLPLHRRVTLATRATVGFLFPSSYGDVVRNHLGDLLPPPTDPTYDPIKAARVRDFETNFFRGFFSGGASSNRGFPIRGIAPHAFVPFLNPATAAQQVAAGALQCDPTKAPQDLGTISSCYSPVGGFTLWELSNELRFKIAGPFSAALFCDMSDVSPQVANIRLDHLHLSCGLGARYDTPVGPIRLDIGYRVQPLQVLGYPNENALALKNPTEGVQPELFGTVPLALAFGIGEAF